jgi:hypothetical protein
VTTLAILLVYPWIAGRVMRFLALPPIAGEHPEHPGKAAWSTCDGDGFFTMGVGVCCVCRQRAKARLCAIAWPVWACLYPFVAIYRAGLGTTITTREPQPTSPEDEIERARRGA